MAELPNTYARRPTPRFGGVDRANPVVPSGDVAIGQSIQNLGKGMGTYLIEAKAKHDKIVLDDYTTRAKMRANEIKRDYEQVRGRDAQDPEFYQRTIAEYEETSKGLLGEIQDDDVRKALSQRLELGKVNFTEGFINHVTEQGAIYRGQVIEGKIETSAADMGSEFDNPGAWGQAYNTLKEGVNDLAQEMGIPQNPDDPAYQNLMRKHLTPGHVNTINAYIEDEDPEGAAGYFEDFGEEISGDLHNDIDALIKKSGIKQASIQYSHQLFDERPDGMTDGEFTRWGTDWIRKNVADKYLDETLRRFKARVGEQEAIDTRIKVEKADEAYGIYNEGVDAGLSPMDAFESIPDTILDAMDQKTVSAMRNMAEKRAQNKTIHTDPETFLDLYEMATGSPAQKAQFRDKNQTNLRNYMDKLSTAHVAYFAKLQDDEDAIAIASTFADLKKEVATAAGYYSPKTGKKKDADAIFEVNGRFDQELLSLQSTTGKEATPADGRAIADRLKIEYIRKGTFGPFSWSTRIPVVEGEIEGVPTESIDEIAYDIREFKRSLIGKGETVYTINGETYKLTGEEPTERDIQLYYSFKSGQLQRSEQPAVVPPSAPRGRYYRE